MNFDAIKERVIKFKDKYWADPVWSKVISTLILSIAGAILTLIWTILKSIYNRISFRTALNQTLDFLCSGSYINHVILIVLAFYLIFGVIKFGINIYKKLIIQQFEEEDQKLPPIRLHSTVLLAQRLSEAFPGQRGLAWYTDPKLITQRLSIVLQDPTLFDPEDVPHDMVSDPIWWYRGYSSMYITKFKKIGSTKALMDFDELNFDKIAVNIDDHYYKSFIYVELKGDKSAGVSGITDEQIEEIIQRRGYASEEVGFFRKNYIKRQEYEDRAIIKKGKIIKAPDSELRVRYLSRYNFLIAAKQSPYNSTKFENESRDIFDGILRGEKSFDDFLATLPSYKKKQSYLD